jgi:catechol 2,3-dioxygenase-like lactoylglutathione lyase family enzyme
VVKEIAFFAYSVRDLPAAVKFYRDVLGLRPGQSMNACSTARS